MGVKTNNPRIYYVKPNLYSEYDINFKKRYLHKMSELSFQKEKNFAHFLNFLLLRNVERH